MEMLTLHDACILASLANAKLKSTSDLISNTKVRMNLRSQRTQKSGLTMASSRINIEVVGVERPGFMVEMDVISETIMSDC